MNARRKSSRSNVRTEYIDSYVQSRCAILLNTVRVACRQFNRNKHLLRLLK